MSVSLEQIQELRDMGLESLGLYYSSYRAFVVDNEDPEFLGRLKLRAPQIHGDEIPDLWAYSRGIYSGAGVGFFAIPAKGEMVWISFESGDVRKPIWEYGHFGTGDMPDAMKNNGTKPTNQVWQSYSGHRIELDDNNKLVRIFSKTGEYTEQNETGYSIVSKKIALGTLNGAKEPAVLGDTAMELLIEFMDDLGKLTTIQTSNGVTGSINTAPGWEALAEKWQTRWKNFKSSKVTLD